MSEEMEELIELISGYEKAISLTLNIALLGFLHSIWLFSEIEGESEEAQEKLMDVSVKTLMRTIRDTLGDGFTKLVITKTLDDLRELFPSNLKFYSLVENWESEEDESQEVEES